MSSNGTQATAPTVDEVRAEEAGESTFLPVAQPGLRIGSYVLRTLVGQGGMGSVWAANRVDSEEQVALKLVRADVANPDALARFAREANLLVRLQHPSVARTFEGGVDKGIPYIVMELLVGRSLSAVLKKESPLPQDRALDLFLRACVGVAVAHSNDIVHRDIKPGNFFVIPEKDGSERVCLLDFGIAKLFDSDVEEATLTQTDMALGTPGYVAPEQFRNAKQADRRADIWSLGMMLFRLLTGQSPFPATSTGEYLTKILSEAPIRLREHRPSAPLSLEQVIVQCLRKDPAQRFGDVRSLVEALAPIAPIQANGAITEIRSLLPYSPPPAGSLLDADTLPILEVVPSSPPPVMTLEPQRRRSSKWVVVAIAGALLTMGVGIVSGIVSSPRADTVAQTIAVSAALPLLSARTNELTTSATEPPSTARPSAENKDIPTSPIPSTSVKESGSLDSPASRPLPSVPRTGSSATKPLHSGQTAATASSSSGKLPWSRDLDDTP